MLSEIGQYFRKPSVLKIGVDKKLLLIFFQANVLESQFFTLFDNFGTTSFDKKQLFPWIIFDQNCI